MAETHSAPTVSVIIPAYNVAEFIAAALESVFAQTFTDYEIVLVNDGSPDTREFEIALQPFRRHPKLIYLAQTNQGAAKARNTAIEHARGEWLAFLDGDDVWLPNYLASQLDFARRRDLQMVYADAVLFGENHADERQTYMRQSKSRGAVTCESLLGGKCNVITSGTIARRDCVMNAGMFGAAAGEIRCEDFELWFRLLKNQVKIGYQREVLLKYRVRNNGLSGNAIEQATRTVNAMRLIRSNFELSANEQFALDRQQTRAAAQVEVEKGKIALRANDFPTARRHFAQAAPFYHPLKATLLNLSLLIAPQFVRRAITMVNGEL